MKLDSLWFSHCRCQDTTDRWHWLIWIAVLSSSFFGHRFYFSVDMTFEYLDKRFVCVCDSNEFSLDFFYASLLHQLEYILSLSLFVWFCSFAALLFGLLWARVIVRNFGMWEAENLFSFLSSLAYIYKYKYERRIRRYSEQANNSIGKNWDV